MLIEKPLATDLAESARVLRAIEKAKVDAVVGYTQRFRRRWLAAKEKVRTGALGDVTLVTSRAFMNRLVAIDNYKRTDDPSTISPMVISGTHALDIVMWMMEAKTPVEVLCALGRQGAGPDLQGHRRHRRHDHVRVTAASTTSTSPGRCRSPGRARSTASKSASSAPRACSPSTTPIATSCSRSRRRRRRATRPTRAGWSTSWAAIRPATWRSASCAGRCARRPIPGSTAWRSGSRRRHATAAEAHRNLMLTKALDLSARLKRAVKLPLAPEEERAAA